MVGMANVGSAINFIINILVIRLIEPIQYSNYLATSSLIIILFSILSFVPYLILKNNMTEVNVAPDNLLNKINMFSFLVLLGVFLFSPVLKWLVKFDSYFYLFISAINSFLLSKLMLFGGICQNKHKYFYVGLKDVTVYFLKFITILVLVNFYNSGQQSIFIAEIISAILVLLFFTKFDLNYFLFRLTRNFLTENFLFVKTIKAYIVAAFTLNFILFVDALVLKRYLVSEETAVISAAFNLSKILVYFSGPINLVLYQYTVISDERKSFYKAFGFSFLGMALLAAIALIGKNGIVQVVFGARNVDLANYFGLALAYSLMVALSTLGINRILAKQDYRFMKFIFLVSIVFIPIFEYVSKYGPSSVIYMLLAFSFSCLVIVGYFTLLSLKLSEKSNLEEGKI